MFSCGCRCCLRLLVTVVPNKFRRDARLRRCFSHAATYTQCSDRASSLALDNCSSRACVAKSVGGGPRPKDRPLASEPILFVHRNFREEAFTQPLDTRHPHRWEYFGTAAYTASNEIRRYAKRRHRFKDDEQKARGRERDNSCYLYCTTQLFSFLVLWGPKRSHKMCVDFSYTTVAGSENINKFSH